MSIEKVYAFAIKKYVYVLYFNQKMERLEEIRQIYKDLDIDDSRYSSSMPDSELKTNFPTRFKNIDITTTCLLAK